MNADERRLGVAQIVAAQLASVARWHEEGVAPGTHAGEGLTAAILDQTCTNYLLWHEEDEACRRDVPDGVLAGVKRAIDRLNQQRNDQVEAIDALIIEDVAAHGRSAPADAPMNTETPGSAFDRLSIAALRVHHFSEELARTDVDEAHTARVRASLARMTQQRDDLARSLTELLDDLYAGRKRLTAYHQFKMYNDPDLNSAVYGGDRAAD